MAKIKNQNLIIVGGKEPVLQEKSVEITENTTTTYTADEGFDGLKSLEVTTNIAGSGGGGSENEIALIERSLTGTYAIPDGTTKVGKYAFYYLEEVKKFIVPNSVKNLSDYCFGNMTSLEEFVYDANLSQSGLSSSNGIFNKTTGRFIVGENVSILPDYLFAGSSSSEAYMPHFTHIVCDRSKALTIGSLLSSSNKNSTIKTIWLDCKANTLTLKTKCLGYFRYLNNMFINCKTTSSITSSTQPFYQTGDNKGLVLKFGSDMTTIPQYFCYNAYIKNVYVPSNIATISANAFNCNSSYQSKLTGITIDRVEPPTLAATNAFLSTNDCPIYVPAESVEAYQGATNWSSYASRITALTYENYSDGVNRLTLGNNLWFDLIVDGVAYNGTYTNTSGKLSLSVFAKEDDSTFSGTIADGVATITVNGTTYTLTLGA